MWPLPLGSRYHLSGDSGSAAIASTALEISSHSAGEKTAGVLTYPLPCNPAPAFQQSSWLPMGGKNSPGRAVGALDSSSPLHWWRCRQSGVLQQVGRGCGTRALEQKPSLVSLKSQALRLSVREIRNFASASFHKSSQHAGSIVVGARCDWEVASRCRSDCCRVRQLPPAVQTDPNLPHNRADQS